jgi:long-chain acyl-CoA synthetase
MDENVYFSIIDRKKEIIISGSYNVHPREVEEVLCEHPNVLEAAVMGVANSYRGGYVNTFITLRQCEKTEEEVVLFCKERLAQFKVPKVVEFRYSLPKSTVGKVLKRALREEEIKKNH